MGSCNCNSARHSHTVSRKLGRFFRTSHRHKYPQIQANKKMKAGSAFVGYYILALLLLNLVNVSKCSDESMKKMQRMKMSPAKKSQKKMRLLMTRKKTKQI